MPRVRALHVRHALLVFAVALAAHGIYAAARGPAVQADGIEYRTLARNLREHHVFSLDLAQGPTIRRAPGFPILIALTGSVTATIVIQVVMSALVALIVFRLAAELTSPTIGLGAGLLYAVHPSSLFWTRMLHSEPSFTFWAMAGLFAVTRGRRGGMILGGLSLGLAALTRPVGAPLLLVITAALIVSKRKHARWVPIMGLLVITPWIIRSSLLAHRFVLLSATSTVNFYIGTQTGQPIYSDEWFHRFLRDDPCGHGFQTATNPVESVTADDVCTRGARAGIARNPAGYLLGRGPALVRLLTSSFDLTLDNQRSTGELRARGRWGLIGLKVFLFVGFCVVPLLLALVGIWSRHPTAILLVVYWLYTIAVHLPGYTEFRYFAPAAPALYVTAALGLRRLIRA